VVADLGRRMESLRFLLRDRDGKYGQSFDAVFEAEEMEILKSAPRSSPDVRPLRASDREHPA
jgi:putative transposase